ncbi:hypothetical protein E4N62_10165 [Streptomyces sp. MNU76]|uniref:hypothetical protein n=1 Tax=Streptomyces sp. MNU76 TaxID=2560026 RepID=UPI001E5686F0|nr:hypothetical protein [Streptomyces sp. MNU76]MCC9705591.1 hypothetical protein [Streptomyces sp. MNU76]
MSLTLQAANRDPSVFADPDTLDVRRGASGHGLHRRIGRSLARAELQVGLPALFAVCRACARPHRRRTSRRR